MRVLSDTGTGNEKKYKRYFASKKNWKKSGKMIFWENTNDQSNCY